MKGYLKKLKSKKGSIFDVLGLILLIPFIVFVIVIMFMAYSNTSSGLEDFQASQSDLTGINESVETFTDNTAKFPSFWDFIFVFLIFGIWLIIFISAFILGNNPVFLVIYGIISFALIIISIVLEVALNEFVQNVLIAAYTVSFPMMIHIISNFLIYALFFIFSIAVALYFKLGASQ